MALDYEDIEKRFDCACKNAVNELSNQYKSVYLEGGPGKLTAFLELIQLQFDQVEATFVRENELHANPEALKRIKAIAKGYARNCLDEYGRISI